MVSCKADIEKNSKFGDAVRTLGTSGTFFLFSNQTPGPWGTLRALGTLETLGTLGSIGILGTFGINEVPKVPKVPCLYFENQKLI